MSKIFIKGNWKLDWLYHRGRLKSVLIIAALITASCTSTTQRPSVAYTAESDMHWVAFLYKNTDKTSTSDELAVSGFNKTGKHVAGPIYPVDKGKHFAISRPAIAYSIKSKVFLVAVAERISIPGGGTYERVAARFFDDSGKLLKNVYHLFDDKSSTLNLSIKELDVGAVRIAYNSILDEFLVTAQRTVFYPKKVVSQKNGVWAQRISYTSGPLGMPQKLAEPGTMNINSHAIAYAPITGTAPKGGRYLLAYGPVSTILLDSNAKQITVVPLELGIPKGGHAQPDVAFGTVNGKQRFLLVYGDKDNCEPGSNPCMDWTGIWGTYIDPYKTSYPQYPSNTPFPISKISSHVGNQYSFQPRVSYNASAKAFFVVWREQPTPSVKVGESRSHIRGNKVDYYVADGQANQTGVKKPYANILISPVTGTCKPSPPTVYCPSSEDPFFPDVTGLGGKAVAVFWHENTKVTANATHTVKGKVVTIP